MQQDPSTKQGLNDILKAFRINAECITFSKVRNVSLYGLRLNPGTRIQVIEKYADELALLLHSKSKISFKPISETGLLQIEVINEAPHKINLLSELRKTSPPKNYNLPVLLGNSIGGADLWIDLSKNPHTLVAGSTGSGKSVLLHTIITNLLLMSYAQLFIVDTKDLEFFSYSKKFENIFIYNTYQLTCEVLIFLLREMDNRYREIRLKNKSIYDFRPLVLIIDEFADLIMQDSDNILYNLICKLTQKCRASNIYCIVSTQRPSVDVIKGMIKANLPARIACKVATRTDSRVILDQNGAELLAGDGDSIIHNYNNHFTRFQAAFTDPKEVLSVRR